MAIGNPKRLRLLPRLASVLVARADLVSVICYAAGLIGVLLLPSLAKETYISENALSPGMAQPKFVDEEARSVAQFMKELQHFAMSSKGTTNHEALLSRIQDHLISLGADTSLHLYAHPKPTLLEQPRDSALGRNLVGIVRAPRGDGKEAIVLVTPLRLSNGTTQAGKLSSGDALALGLGEGLFRHLSKARWLAKDVIWLIADASEGVHVALTEWLKEYHSGISSLASAPSAPTEPFLRAGSIAAAVVLDVHPSYRSGSLDLLEVHAEGHNGQMPNLDLINTAYKLAGFHQGPTIGIPRAKGVSKWLGPALPLLADLAKQVKGVDREDYKARLEMLAQNLVNQALGVPTAAHGAFREYTIDAISLVAFPTGANTDLSQGADAALLAGLSRVQQTSIYKISRLVESLFRCINNLLEKFHHSSFLYLLAGPNRYISIGEYMILFALLLAGIPLKAAALASRPPPSRPQGEEASSRTGSRWGAAIATVGAVHCWAWLTAVAPAGIAPLAPSLARWLGVEPRVTASAVWLAGSSLGLGLLGVVARWAEVFAGGGGAEEGEFWVALKCVALSVAGCSVAAVAQIDFALGLGAAAVMTPVCLLAQPLRTSLRQGKGAATAPCRETRPPAEQESESSDPLGDLPGVGLRSPMSEDSDKGGPALGDKRLGLRLRKAAQKASTEGAKTEAEGQLLHESTGSQSPSLNALVKIVESEFAELEAKQRVRREKSVAEKLRKLVAKVKFSLQAWKEKRRTKAGNKPPSKLRTKLQVVGNRVAPALGITLAVATSPAAMLILSASASELEGLNGWLSMLWRWPEFYWHWGTAAYPFLMGCYLPCSLLCMLICAL